MEGLLFKGVSGHFKIVISILIWSSLGIIVRYLALPPHVITFYSSLSAVFFQLAILSYLSYKGGISRQRIKGPDLILLLLGLFSLINTILYYFAFLRTTIANAVFSHYTAPIFVALLAPILIKERIEKKTWVAIPIASSGLFLMFFNSGLTSGIKGGHTPGLLAGTASGLAYALIIIIAKRIASSYSPYVIAIVSNGLIALILLPFVLIEDYTLTAITLSLLLLMGLVHSTIALILYLDGFKGVKAQEAAVLGYIEPIGAIILAFLLLGEIPSGTAIIGGILIILAGYLVTLRR